jgi:hypothetical protein
MYGARPQADLAVTRFYTSPAIYQVLETIHEFDAGLREAFQNGGYDAGVVFIRQEGQKIVACSPNKVLISTLTTLKGGKRLLPIGFQTGYKTHIINKIEKLDHLIDCLAPTNQPYLVDLKSAAEIVALIDKTYDYNGDPIFKWNVEAFLASLAYITRMCPDPDQKGKIYLLVRKGRDNVRIRQEGRYFDTPDTSHIEGEIAKQVAINTPMLMLFRQQGAKDRGWRDCPFWWPVLHMPQKMGTVVFASDVNDYDAGETEILA